jgi:hypothetical protein
MSDSICEEFICRLSALDPEELGDDLVYELGDLVETIEDHPDPRPVFPAVFLFFEAHPDADLGMPGPLVHLLEGTYPGGYEELLVQSLARKPVSLTLWMANRLLNGNLPQEQKENFLGLLRKIAEDTSLGSHLRDEAHDFLDSQSAGCQPPVLGS